MVETERLLCSVRGEEHSGVAASWELWQEMWFLLPSEGIEAAEAEDENGEDDSGSEEREEREERAGRADGNLAMLTAAG